MIPAYSRARLAPHAFEHDTLIFPPDTAAQVYAMAQAAQPRTRQSFHINTEEPGDQARLRQTLDAWQPSGALLLGSGAPNGLARELSAQLAQWNGFSIYRPFEGQEGNLWTVRSPQAHAQWAEAMSLPDNCWLNVGNEPIPNQNAAHQMSDWYEALADEFAARGLRGVFPGGFASGAFERSQIMDGWFDGLLRGLIKYREHKHRGLSVLMLGVHTYAHALLPWHCAGRDVNLLMNREAIQKQSWPMKAEIFDADRSDNWLVLREDWLQEQARILANDPTLNLDTVVTEWFLDDMPNIGKQYPQVYDFINQKCGRQYRGLPTVAGYYAWAFPQWSFAEAVCEQLAWAEQVYPAHYRLFCTFAWSQNALWRDNYDVSGLTSFLSLWPQYAAKVEPMPTTPVPALPSITEAGVWQAGVLLPGLIRLRAAPYTTATADHPAGETLAVLPAGAAIKMWIRYPAYFESDGYAWFGIWYLEQNVVGWMALVEASADLQFDMQPPIDPTPEPEPTGDYVTQDQLDLFKEDIMTWVEEKFAVAPKAAAQYIANLLGDAN